MDGPCPECGKPHNPVCQPGFANPKPQSQYDLMKDEEVALALHQKLSQDPLLGTEAKNIPESRNDLPQPQPTRNNHREELLGFDSGNFLALNTKKLREICEAIQYTKVRPSQPDEYVLTFNERVDWANRLFPPPKGGFTPCLCYCKASSMPHRTLADPKPFPVFVRRDKKLILNTDIKKILLPYQELFVLVVFGTQGAGKSTLCNLLSGTTCFDVGQTGDECTKGVEGLVLPHHQNPNVGVLLLDAEGDSVEAVRTLQIQVLTSVVGHAMVYCFSGTLPSNTQHLNQDLTNLSLLMGVNRVDPSKRTAAQQCFDTLLNNTIVYNRATNGISEKTGSLRSIWETHLKAFPAPVAFVSLHASEGQGIWEQSGDNRKAGYRALLHHLSHLLGTSSSTPSQIIEKWIPYLEVVNSEAIEEFLSPASTKNMHDIFFQNFLQRKVSEFIQILPLPTTELKLKWREFVRRVIPDADIMDVQTSINQLKDTVFLKNIELVVDEEFSKVEKLKKEERWEEFAPAVSSIFYSCFARVRGLLDNQDKLLEILHSRIDERKEDLRKAIPIRYKYSLSTVGVTLRFPTPAIIPEPVAPNKPDQKVIPGFQGPSGPTQADVSSLRAHKGGSGTTFLGKRHTRTWTIYDSDGTVIGHGTDKKHHSIAKAKAEAQALAHLQKKHETQLATAKKEYEAKVQEIKEANAANQLTYEQTQAAYAEAKQQYDQKVAEQNKLFERAKSAIGENMTAFLLGCGRMAQPHFLAALFNINEFDSLSNAVHYIGSRTLQSAKGSCIYITAAFGVGLLTSTPVLIAGAASVASTLVSAALEGRITQFSDVASALAWTSIYSIPTIGTAIGFARDLNNALSLETTQNIRQIEKEKRLPDLEAAWRLRPPLTRWSEQTAQIMSDILSGKTDRIIEKQNRDVSDVEGVITKHWWFHQFPLPLTTEIPTENLICTWTKEFYYPACLASIKRAPSSPFHDQPLQGLGITQEGFHDAILRAFLTHCEQQPTLLSRVVGTAFVTSKIAATTVSFLEEYTGVSFLHQFPYQENSPLVAWHTQNIMTSQIKQMVYGLAELHHPSIKFTAYDCSLKNFAVKPCGDEIILYQIGEEILPVDVIGSVVKLASCPYGSALIGPTTRCYWAGNSDSFVSSLVATVLPTFAAANLQNIQFSTEFSDTFDIHVLFAELSKTWLHGCWRHPIVTAFLAESQKKLALAHQLDHVHHDRYVGDSITDLIDFGGLRFFLDPVSPNKNARLTATDFALMLHRFPHYSLDPSLPLVMEPSIPPVPASNRNDQEALSFNIPNTVSSEWIPKVSDWVYLDHAIPEPNPIDKFDSLNEKCKCYLTKGKSGDLIYRAKVNGRPAVLKHFTNLTPDALLLDSSMSPDIKCGGVALEVIASMAASSLYDRGISPHFPRVFGVFKKIERKEENIGYVASWFRKPEITVTTSSVYLVSEFIEGGTLLEDFNRVICTLQHRAEKANKPVFLREVYIHNAIFQVIGLLHTWQTQFKGMHNDLHLANLMIKLCDETPFNGKPLKDYQFFSYKFGADEFQLPNLGFIVKVIDFGLSSLSIGPSLRYLPKPSSPLWKRSREALGNLFQGKELTRFIAADHIRKSGHFRSAMDLQTVMNHFSSHPLFYRNFSTIRFEELEYSRHWILSGDQTPKSFEPLNVSLHNSIFNFPTARVPKSIEDAKMTPQDFALSSAFLRYSKLCFGLKWEVIHIIQEIHSNIERVWARTHRPERTADWVQAQKAVLPQDQLQELEEGCPKPDHLLRLLGFCHEAVNLYSNLQ